jgi:hypothetical protein
MKKTLLLLFVCIAFIACEGPEGPMGPVGPQGEPGTGTNWYATSYTIQPNEWELVGNKGELNSYFFVDKPLPRLSDFVYEDGSILVYLEFSPNVKNVMPFVSHKAGVDDLGEFFWTETYDYDFYKGGIGFYLTYSDFNTKMKPNQAITFHVILMWP